MNYHSVNESQRQKNCHDKGFRVGQSSYPSFLSPFHELLRVRVGRMVAEDGASVRERIIKTSVWPQYERRWTRLTFQLYSCLSKSKYSYKQFLSKDRNRKVNYNNLYLKIEIHCKSSLSKILLNSK